MCRLVAITSKEYFSPMENVLALDTMKEGHDGSGLGLVLKNLGGEFEEYKQYPILSAVCSGSGMTALNSYMNKMGFNLKYKWRPKIRNGSGRKRYDYYIANAYDYPEACANMSPKEKEDLLMRCRLDLRSMGEGDGSIFVFSFYPDIITLKEVGGPLEIAEFFGLDKDPLQAKIIFAQGRQNTNYEIYLYACHPFFIQGYCSMTNGENTAFIPIKEYLMSRGNAGYMGYNSDSEVFTHILHYVCRELGYPLTYYKDVITPLNDSELQGRPDRDALGLIRMSLRPLCIDGPNCVIGFTPDGTCFMAQDSKKLRPGVVGGTSGKYGLMSEECGLDRALPQRDRTQDIFPMKYDMVIVKPEAEEVIAWNQLKG
jgi:glutamate synthase domain-containing protein 1